MNIEQIINEAEQLGVAFRLVGNTVEMNSKGWELPFELLNPLRSQRDRVAKVIKERPANCSSLQRAYWIGERGGLLGSAPAIYFVELEIPPINVRNLQRTIEKIFLKHEMLRLGINESGKLQHSGAFCIPELKFLTVSTVDPDGKNKIEKFRNSLAASRFDFDRGCPFAVGIIQQEKKNAHLLLTLPLWRFDARSVQILIEEMLDSSTDMTAEKERTQEKFSYSIKKWNERRAIPRFDHDRKYWMDRVDKLPSAPVLPGRGRPLDTGFDSGFLRHVFSRVDGISWTKLREQAARRSLTLPSILLAAFGCSLSRLSANDHFILTCLESTRETLGEGAATCIGNFGDTTCVEIDRRSRPTFKVFASSLQTQMWTDRAHSSFSGTEVAAAWRRMHEFVDGPTFPITFTVVRNMSGEHAKIIPEQSRLSVPQVYMDHQVFIDETSAVLSIDYREGVYADGLPEEILATYKETLIALADDDANWELELPGRKGSWPSPPTSSPLVRPGQRLEDGFLSNAACRPDRVALVSNGYELTYGSLLSLALETAANLLAHGAKSGDRVAIYTEKGVDEIVAVLGTLLADMVYVPIHPSLPVKRIESIVASCGIRLALTAKSDASTSILSTNKNQILFIDISTKIRIDESTRSLPLRKTPLAYIIHTSGTTGDPKGVAMTHFASLNTIMDLVDRYRITSSDSCLGLSQLSFDLSVFDIFGTLGVGGTLVLPHQGQERVPAAWAALCKSHNISIWNSVPALMELVLDGRDVSSLNSLRLIFLSGDRIQPKLVKDIRLNLSNAKIVAMGGATEAGIWSILHEIRDEDPYDSGVPYGTSMRGQGVYVLDKGGREAAPFEQGGIYISGAGLAEGYWNDPAKTRTSFITQKESGMRLYNTGDLGRYQLDGTIEFLGRRDTQIKVQGYRIECGDVEAAILVDQAISQTVVVGARNERGVALHAYVVRTKGEALDPVTLFQGIALRLPNYMVPTRIFEVDSIPLNNNGKVDKAALMRIPSEDIGVNMAEDVDDVPRAGTESLLAKEWEKLLNTPSVGRNDNFFSLGGTSFTGMMLMSRLAEKYDNPGLSLGHLTAYPTVKLLANSLDMGASTVPSYLRRVGRPNKRRPVILFPPIGGNSACYAPLTALLEDEFDVYAITAVGLASECLPLTTVAEMADFYADLTHDVIQSRSPILMGWSMGGILALEVGQRLKSFVEPHIITIDTRLARCGGDSDDFSDMDAFLRDVKLSGNHPHEMEELLRSTETERPERKLAQAAFNVFSANRDALRRYKYISLNTSVTAFVASQAGSVSGLEKISDSVETVVLDADHYSILRSGQLEVIAGRCRDLNTFKYSNSRGMLRLQHILKRVRPTFDLVLAPTDVIGPELGFSSIEQIRIRGLIEKEVGFELVNEEGEVLSVSYLCKLLS